MLQFISSIRVIFLFISMLQVKFILTFDFSRKWGVLEYESSELYNMSQSVWKAGCVISIWFSKLVLSRRCYHNPSLSSLPQDKLRLVCLLLLQAVVEFPPHLRHNKMAPVCLQSDRCCNHRVECNMRWSKGVIRLRRQDILLLMFVNHRKVISQNWESYLDDWSNLVCFASLSMKPCCLIILLFVSEGI